MGPKNPLYPDLTLTTDMFYRLEFDRATRVLEACVKVVAELGGLNCPNDYLAQRAVGLAALVMKHADKAHELFSSEDGQAANSGALKFD